jgi:acyl-CoA thioesterase-1
MNPSSGRGVCYPMLPRKTRIVALGDSLTAGYGLRPSDAFPARLERMLRERDHAIEVINEGVSGDDAAGGLSRLSRVLAHNPDIVIVALGANDGLRFYDPESTHSALDRILHTLTERGIRVVFAGIEVPGFAGIPFVRAFHDVFARLARAYPQAVFYPSLLAGVLGSAEHNLPDGIHPNAAGARVIARSLLPYVERAIATPQRFAS